MIWQAVWAGFSYFQREAGYTRTGSHGTRVNGRETGQWREADLAVAHWLQHTSRDGDMQLHVHSQIAHVARTTTDGKWRAPDSLGYNEHIGAVAAIVSQHLEEALTRRFGLEWTARDDGHGFEIKGISGQMMRLFSSRRESITADLRARAARFEQRYGRAPSQRELAHLAQASNFKTRNPKHRALDLAQAHADWADKLTHTLGVNMASIAPSVWHEAGRATTRGTTSPGPALTQAELTRAQAAHALEAHLGRLAGALTGAAPDTHARPTETGLREDQAAAALAALTDGRLVSVINAPAGSGKTRVLAEAARIWAEVGLGPVIGITPSQSARNTLAVGVPVSYNAAQFLGHLPGRRGARGPVLIHPGTLLVVDEASMLSGPDLAGLIAYAKSRGAKIILAGDVSQLQAVENGGGMSLLPSHPGYAPPAEPVRVRPPLEQ